MLRIWRPSGQELATFNAEQFEDAAALKEHVCEHYGFPVYLQQLLHDGSLLADDAKLDGFIDLQLVLLSISGPQLLAEDHLSKAARAQITLKSPAPCWKLVLKEIVGTVTAAQP